jgi:two-component system response regulator YesN
MSILVVDDEYYARKAMAKIIRRCPTYIREKCSVFESANTSEAINQMKTVPADIVFADIKMPGMDGIELCEYLRENYPKTVLVIVSGYAEFEYARRAIKTGIFDYLTKPVDEDEIERILAKAFEHLRSLNNEDEESKENRERLKYAVISDKLSQLIYKAEKAWRDDSCNLGYTLDIGQNITCYNIIVIVPKKASREKFLEARQSFIWHIKKHMERNIFWLSFQRGSELLVLKYYTETHPKSPHNELKEYIEVKRWIQEGERRFSLELIAGISPCHNEAAELHIAYHEALRAVWNEIIMPDKDVRQFDASAIKTNVTIITNTARRLISFYLLKGKTENAKLYIAKLFKDSFKRGNMAVDDFIEGLVDVLLEMSRCAKRYSAGSNWNFPTIMEDALSCYDYDEIENFLIHIVDKFNEVQSSDHEKINITDEVRHYLEENYYEDINLYNLAQNVFFVNPNYLSRIFKVETGMSFSKYLLKVRMEKAQELLKQEDIKIMEVARLVGYNSVPHFVQKFKKYFGYTPAKIRGVLR